MTLPTSFPSEKLQTVDRRNGMGGYWTGTSDDADALVATLGDFFVFNGDKRVGPIAISNWSGKGSSTGKATLVSYQGIINVKNLPKSTIIQTIKVNF